MSSGLCYFFFICVVILVVFVFLGEMAILFGESLRVVRQTWYRLLSEVWSMKRRHRGGRRGVIMLRKRRNRGHRHCQIQSADHLFWMCDRHVWACVLSWCTLGHQSIAPYVCGSEHVWEPLKMTSLLALFNIVCTHHFCSLSVLLLHPAHVTCSSCCGRMWLIIVCVAAVFLS